MDRRQAMAAVAGLPFAHQIKDVVAVKSDDVLVFTVHAELGPDVVVDYDSFWAELTKAGIAPKKCVVVVGMDVTAAPKSTHLNKG